MKDKVKVLQYTGAMNRAGAETLLMNIYRNIDRERFEFHFVSHTEESCDYDEEIVRLGGKIIYISKPDIKNINKFQMEFRKLIKENGPYNAIHSHMQLLNGLVLKEAAKNNIKNRICHAHLNGDYCKDNFLRKIYRWNSKNLILKYSTERLACSQLSGKYLYSGRIFNLVNNAINIDEFNLNENRDYIYNKLNLDKNIKLITHIGRFVEAKNHNFIIDVFEKIVSYDKNYRLLLVGQGELFNNIKNKVKEKNLEEYVYFLGLRTDINKILSSTEVFFMPSLLEGLPVALVEAQAAGVKCVISDTIPKDCDMGLDLITALSLDDSISIWAKTIIKLKYEYIDFKIRKDKIIKNGYDLQNNISYISKLYLK